MPSKTRHDQALRVQVFLYTAATTLSATFLLVLSVGYLANVNLPYDGQGYLLGRDFVNTWMGGRAVFLGQVAAWFDPDTYNAALRELFGANYWKHLWSYPPHLLLLTWPLGLLPYFPALFVWYAIGLLIYFYAGSEGFSRRSRLFLLAVSPAVFANILTGQNGFFTAALLIGGLLNLDRRPIVAGVLFGILTVKPQLGLLLPVMLIVTGRWRVIAAASVTAVGLAALSVWAFGIESWMAYVLKALPRQGQLLAQNSGFTLGLEPTVFASFRIAGVPPDAAMVAQIAMAAGAVGAVVWTFWRRRDPMLSVALLITATFLATPYALIYDMVVIGWVVVLIREHPHSTAWDHGLALAVWSLPITSMVLGAGDIPGAAFALVLFGVRIVWRLGRGEISGAADNAAKGPLISVPLRATSPLD